MRRFLLPWLAIPSRLFLSTLYSIDFSQTRIHMPPREHGYRTVPLQWEEVVQIIQSNDLALLSRSVEQEKDYQIYMRDLKQEWQSVYHHILHTKFQCRKQRNPDGKWYAIKKSTDQQLVVVPNDFPYYLEDGIQHWVLWKLGGTCTPDDIAHGQRQIQNAIQATEFLHWINPPHLKSLPDIDHVHYLCKT